MRSMNLAGSSRYRFCSLPEQTLRLPNTCLPTLKTKHHQYRFIDLGTLGGSVSYESPNGEGNQILKDSGVIAFSADTSLPDPHAPDFCFSPECFVTHAVRPTQVSPVIQNLRKESQEAL